MTPRAAIEHVMHLLRNALAPVVTEAFRGTFGKRALDAMEKALKSDKVTVRLPDDAALSQLDVMGWLNLIMRRWDEVFKDDQSNEVRSYVGELIQARHHWAHQGDFSVDDTYRVIDTAYRLARAFNLPDASGKLGAMRATWHGRVAAAMTGSVQPSDAAPQPASPERTAADRPTVLPARPSAIPSPPEAPRPAALETEIAAWMPRWSRAGLRAEVVRLLRTLPDANVSGVQLAIAPREMFAPSDPAANDSPRLLILPPEYAHAPGARSLNESPAMKRAHALHWHETAYLAMDLTRASRTGDAIRHWLAVCHVGRLAALNRQRGRADVTPESPSNDGWDAAQMRAHDEVIAALQAAYRWLIVLRDETPTMIELHDDAPLIAPAAYAARFYLHERA